MIKLQLSHRGKKEQKRLVKGVDIMIGYYLIVCLVAGLSGLLDVYIAGRWFLVWRSRVMTD